MMRLFFFFLLLGWSGAGCAKTVPTLMKHADEEAMNQWVEERMRGMSEDERIGQLIMILAPVSMEPSNVASLVKLVKEQKVGGILFSKGAPETQARLTNRLQQEARTPLMIGLDGEWGLSMRLSGTTRFPRNMTLGAIPDVALIEQYGEEVGRQCRAMGIHVNFAPVLDVNVNPLNPVIGNRSFGEDPELVAERALAYAKGLEKAGVISCAKHFPGHGNTETDSHKALPVINEDRRTLKKVEFYPFVRYIKSGFSGMMTAHLDIPALGTDGRPGSMCKQVVTDLLHNSMGFDGLCFTDGLAMKGAAVEGESVAVMGIEAGNDVLLGPINPAKEALALKNAIKTGRLKMSDIDAHCRKILQYKYIAGLNKYKPIDITSLKARLNTPEADFLNARLNAQSITVIKNSSGIIPLKRLERKRIAAVASGGAKDNAFHTVLKRYAKVDCFLLPDNVTAEESRKVYRRLKDYDLVIYSVHSKAGRDNADLQQLADDKKLILTFFTTPYRCADFRHTVEAAQAVVVAYEATPLAESYAAQTVFGGSEALGALPVGVPGMFNAGLGFHTEKCRLGYQKPEAAGLNSLKLQAIDSIARQGLEKEAYPGCRVIVGKDGMIVYDKSFGYYDFTNKEPVTESTVYDLASVSKVIGTLPGVMLAYDEHKLSLTDRISEFIPELQQTDKQDIILRDMLYHQSGLPSVINFYEQTIDRSSYSGSLYSGRLDARHTVRYGTRTYINPNFRFLPENVSRTKREGFEVQAGRSFYLNDAFPTDSILSGVIRAKLDGAGRYRYSCVNFILLKMMIERLYGEPMDRLLDNYFYSRLGAWSMTYNPLQKYDSSYIAPTEKDVFIRRQTLRGYVHDEAAAFQGGVSGNAGLFATAGDLAKICQMYLNDGKYGGETYLSVKTCRMFTESRNSANRRGLGFDKPDVRNRSQSPCSPSAPPSVYGHTGFTGTCFWIDPDNKMFFIFLSNRTFPSRTNQKLFSLDVRKRMQEAIYNAFTQTSY